MDKSLLVNATQAKEEIRFAIVDTVSPNQYYLENFFNERPGQQKKSNIYKGVITRIEPSLQAAFINFGMQRHGFLPFKEVAKIYFRNPDLNPDECSITEALTEGQEVMVQIDKEERGNKGAALTTNITLAGSYLVLMPNSPRAGGISRRIEGDERDELRESLNALSIPDDMGLIIRTAGVGKSLGELQWDLDILLHLWSAITKAYNAQPAPFLIHQESDIVTRAIRDYLRQDIQEIIIDNQEIYQKIKQHLELIRPEFADRVRFYDSTNPLFTHYQVENQIESAFQSEVRLPSGGSIVIQQTEAMVTIDVNSSRDTKGGHIEQTAFNTNREAAVEVARQLRLRDLGGLIVVDFIDMLAPENQRIVVEVFESEIKIDKARVQYGRISKFGLLEISRQRLRPSLIESSHVICPRCNGEGSIRSIESLSLYILRLLREGAALGNLTEIIAQCPVPVATFLLNEKRDSVGDIEREYNIRVRVIPNPYMETPDYKIEKIYAEQTGGGHKNASYKLAEPPELEIEAHKHLREPVAEPAVTMEMPTRPQGLSHKQGGLIKRLWGLLFKSEKGYSERPYSDAAFAPSTERTTSHHYGRGQRPRDRDYTKSRSGGSQGQGQSQGQSQGQGQGQGQGQKGKYANKRPPRSNNPRGPRPGQHNKPHHHNDDESTPNIPYLTENVSHTQPQSEPEHHSSSREVVRDFEPTVQHQEVTKPSVVTDKPVWDEEHTQTDVNGNLMQYDVSNSSEEPSNEESPVKRTSRHGHHRSRRRTSSTNKKPRNNEFANATQDTDDDDRDRY